MTFGEKIKNLRKKLANLDVNVDVLNRINHEINRYENMTDMSPEVGVVRNYIDWLLEIPWDRETLDIENLNDIKENLNKTHFGLDSAKLRIIEYLAVKKRNDIIRNKISNTTKSILTSPIYFIISILSLPSS